MTNEIVNRESISSEVLFLCHFSERTMIFMGLLSGLFRIRGAPKDSTAGSAYRFLWAAAAPANMYAKKDKIQVSYFDTETLGVRETEMYITGFKSKLEKDKATAGFAVCRLILILLLFYSCLDFTQNLGKTRLL